MKIRTITTSLAALSLASSAWARIAYVGTENAVDDAEHGTSADKPFASIKYAVESIQPAGGTVYVAKGTYSWNAADVNSYMITLTNATKIIGATGKASDVIIKPTTTTSCRGVKLTHGDAGIRFLTIRDCYLKNNNSTIGGGIYMTAGTVEDCIVSNCTGGHWSSGGSGIYLCGGRVSRTIVRDCTIANNTVYGCGIYANHGNSIVEDCLITGNTCYSAGAIRAAGRVTVVNCTVVANSGTSDSGIWAAGYKWRATSGWATDYPVVVNCAIYNNKVSSDSTGHGGVWIADKVTSFKYCASLNGIEGSVEPVTGNADFKDLVGGDYRINSTSCCLDAGVDPLEYVRQYSTDYTPSATDLDGNPRTVGKVDIGCYENQKNEVECTIAATSDTLLTPVDVTLTATASGASGTVSYDWLVSNRVTAVTAEIAAGTASETIWQNATPGYYDVYLTLTDDNGAHAFSSLQAIKLSPPHLYLATNKTVGVTPTYPYDSPEKAAFWMTDLVDTAEAGATIHVAAGEYLIDYSHPGWNITKGIKVLGADPANPDATRFRDTQGALFGNFTCRPLFINHADAFVAHLTLANGALDNDHGGCVKMGVYGGCVSNCVIRNGSVRNNDIIGCGAFAEGGLITHCVITNNCLGDSRPRKTCGIGLGVRGTGKASNCLIAYNYPNVTGGFAASADGNGVIENCTIVANRITDAYATVRVDGSAQVRNCAIAGNVLTSSGDPAPHVWTNLTTAAMHFVNCASDGAGPINDSCYRGELARLFTDAQSGNYVPQPSSPLCNHGATPVQTPGLDLAGNPRIFGRAIDIGCYECQKTPGLVIVIQ